MPICFLLFPTRPSLRSASFTVDSSHLHPVCCLNGSNKKPNKWRGQAKRRIAWLYDVTHLKWHLPLNKHFKNAAPINLKIAGGIFSEIQMALSWVILNAKLFFTFEKCLWSFSCLNLKLLMQRDSLVPSYYRKWTAVTTLILRLETKISEIQQI